MIHVIEVTLESVHVGGPEPAELGQPDIHLLKWFRFKAVQAALCVHGGLHETSVPQHTKVLRDGRLRHTKLTLDLANGLSGGAEKAEYGAAVRLGDDFENGFHALNIRDGVYTCQGIFAKMRKQVLRFRP